MTKNTANRNFTYHKTPPSKCATLHSENHFLHIYNTRKYPKQSELGNHGGGSDQTRLLRNHDVITIGLVSKNNGKLKKEDVQKFVMVLESLKNNEFSVSLEIMKIIGTEWGFKTSSIKTALQTIS